MWPAGVASPRPAREAGVSRRLVVIAAGFSPRPRGGTIAACGDVLESCSRWAWWRAAATTAAAR